MVRVFTILFAAYPVYIVFLTNSLLFVCVKGDCAPGVHQICNFFYWSFDVYKTITFSGKS